MSQRIFTVEKILDHKVGKRGSLYLIKWKNFSNKHNTWEPPCNCHPSLISEYHTKHAEMAAKAKNKKNPTLSRLSEESVSSRSSSPTPSKSKKRKLGQRTKGENLSGKRIHVDDHKNPFLNIEEDVSHRWRNNFDKSSSRKEEFRPSSPSSPLDLSTTYPYNRYIIHVGSYSLIVPFKKENTVDQLLVELRRRLTRSYPELELQIISLHLMDENNTELEPKAVLKRTAADENNPIVARYRLGSLAAGSMLRGGD